MVSAALKLEPIKAPVGIEGRSEIALQGVGVTYARRTVLSGVNLEIAAGEFVVVLGETGCGKSTLLRLILGQEFPTSGHVIVDGKPVRRIDARCGYVPQKYSLFPDRTVLGNVMYGPQNATEGLFGRFKPSFWKYRSALEADARMYLERMGLRPQDLTKYPHQLSGGMQQRVAIAQALLMRPPVLLMDEAFSALDLSTRENLQEQLHEAWRETKPTVVFVTHNTSEALLMGTRIILLGRHRDGQGEQSNVLLDAEIPTSRMPFARRKQSTEFREFRDYVKRLAYRSSSMYCEEEAPSSSLLAEKF